MNRRSFVAALAGLFAVAKTAKATPPEEKPDRINWTYTPIKALGPARVNRDMEPIPTDDMYEFSVQV